MSWHDREHERLARSLHERHDLDPDVMTDTERRAKRRYDAYFAFETMPDPLLRLPGPGLVDDEQT